MTDESVPQLEAKADFRGFNLQRQECGHSHYYVLWRGDEVRARGDADTIRSALRADVNYKPIDEVRDWEPPGYEHI